MIKNNDFESFLFQLGIFSGIIILLIFRIIGGTIESEWIWLVNYLGMCIAFINLLVNKYVMLRGENHKKYKAFAGFSIISILILCGLGILVYKVQTIKSVNVCVNDCITLLALLFSLSPLVWEVILDFVVKIIHK